MNSLILFAERAGITGYPLLILAVFTGAVVCERIVYYIRLGMKYRGFSHSKYRDFVKKRERIPDDSHYVTGIFNRYFPEYTHTALETAKQYFEAEWNESNRYIKFLEYSVGIAPLLGILGTITGIIKSFSAMGNFSSEVRAIITGGIAEALITTAAGLIIAVIALTALYIFKWFQKKWFQPVEECLTLLEAALKDSVHE